MSQYVVIVKGYRYEQADGASPLFLRIFDAENQTAALADAEAWADTRTIVGIGTVLEGSGGRIDVVEKVTPTPAYEVGVGAKSLVG